MLWLHKLGIRIGAEFDNKLAYLLDPTRSKYEIEQLLYDYVIDVEEADAFILLLARAMKKLIKEVNMEDRTAD